MTMTSITIDLDKYEFLNDPTDQRGYEGEYNGLLTDYQPIDAEIIDDGISEDEMEETSMKQPLACATPSFAADTKKQDPVNDSSVTDNSKSRTVCIKVVDCEKYSWYYPKYKHRILERKYLYAKKHAKNIIKCLKNVTSKPPVVIDVDDLSNSSLNVESSVQNDSSVKISQNKRKLKTSIRDEPVYSTKAYKKWGIARQKHISDREMVEIQKVVSEKQTSSTMVNIQKNKGLVGMKVQRISECDKSEENRKDKSIEKNGKPKSKVTKQKHKYSSELDLKAGDRIFESFSMQNLNIPNNSVFDRTQTNKISDTKKDQCTSDDETTQPPGKNELKKCVSLKCSLKINSPKILMSIKKITSPKEHKSNKTKENEVAACLIANEKKNSFKDHQKHSKNNNTVRKYKPMPKSKRAALEKYKNMDNEHEKPEDIENRLNKKTEELKIISTIVTSPNSFNKHITNSEIIFATNLTQKNCETYNQSFLYTNKFTEKVLKLTNNKKQFTKKDLEAKNEKFDHLKASKTMEPLKPLLTKSTHSVSLGNKYEVAAPLSYISNNKEQEQNMGPVTKPIDLSIENHKHGPSSDPRDSYFINKNMNIPSLVQLNENNRDNKNNRLPISSNVINSTNNWTGSSEELYGVDTRNTMITSMDCTNEASPMLSLSHFINQHLEEGSVIKEADKSKQSEFNLPLKNTDNNEDFLKASRFNQSNIHSIITSSQEPSESQEYIVPNVEQRLSNNNLIHGIVRDGDISHLNENINTKTIARLTQSSVSVSQDISAKSQKNNNSLTQNSDQHFFSDNNSRNPNNTVVYKSHIPSKSQLSVLVRPPIISVPPDTRTRPDIITRQNHEIRPYYEATFQIPPKPLPDTRHRLSTLDTTPYRQMPCAVRPQGPLRQVPQWRFNPYQQPDHAFPPGSDNINRIPGNNINQYTGINYEQNDYTPHVYNNLSYQEMLHNTHMPPGICDVQPNNMHWPYDLYCPTIPLPHLLPPPPYQNTSSNSENSIIIGENFTGVAKKINIPHLNLSNKVDKDGKLSQENTNTDVFNPKNTKTVNNATNSSADKTTPISKKSDMMKKAVTPVEGPRELESNRSYGHKPRKEQMNKKQTSRPGPLPRKKTLNYEPDMPRNTKQISKTGYSPPILPIPTFQNVLSEVQAGVSNVGVQFKPQSGQSKILSKSFIASTMGYIIPKAIPKNIVPNQSKKTYKNVVLTEEDHTKKISLEEYKKRSFKVKKKCEKNIKVNT